MVDSYQPLTDSQWQVMASLLPVQRKRRLCLRQVVNAIFYVCRTGCQWRALPVTFPAWTAVYYSFYHWQRTGRWQRLNQVLNVLDRLREGRPCPRWRVWTAKAYAWPRAFSSTAASMGANA